MQEEHDQVPTAQGAQPPSLGELDEHELDDLEGATAEPTETTADIATGIAQSDDPEATKEALDALAGNDEALSNDPNADGHGDISGEADEGEQAEPSIDELDLEGLREHARQTGVDLDRLDADGAVLVDEPASVRAAWLRAVIAAHITAADWPPATDWLEAEIDPSDTAALAAAATTSTPEEPALGMQEFRGVTVGQVVKVHTDHQEAGEPSIFAGHAGRVVEIDEDSTHAEDGTPFVVDFGDERGQRSFHRDELEIVGEL